MSKIWPLIISLWTFGLKNLYSSRCIISKLSWFQVAWKNKRVAYIIHGYWTLRIFTPRPVMRMRALFFCFCFPSCQFMILVDIDRLLKSISKILSAKEEFHAFRVLFNISVEWSRACRSHHNPGQACKNSNQYLNRWHNQ